ncbi:hypothetical protein SPI_09123 [Niveomyces insectorum RCEF 264]|uniref:Uncharacterized protein n=1 Tax=Niveomyces insectorum RCEF 264 TaxID=1081102 RepID=A0A167M4J5_9HYPO|nr:hypothetical protein SPI_09123 [Niveomyces insectorum RCEF 264]
MLASPSCLGRLRILAAALVFTAAVSLPAPAAAALARSPFTKSPIFTNSSIFSNSSIFANSSVFTNSSIFTNSSVFTNSSIFTNSTTLTNSTIFTNTSTVTNSSIFTNTSATNLASTCTGLTYFGYCRVEASCTSDGSAIAAGRADLQHTVLDLGQCIGYDAFSARLRWRRRPIAHWQSK